MSFAEIFSRMSEVENRKESAARPLPEATCADLREAFARYARSNPFKQGDLVTPVASSDLMGAGEPHIVLEVRDRPEPEFTCARPQDASSNAYGSRRDIRVASRKGESLPAHWVESYHFEPYRGPGADA